MNSEGLNLIKSFEGLRLEAYVDPAGIWTIGYGHTGRVKPGERITGKEAERLLCADLAATEAGVACLLRVSVNDNEFSALVALAFNIGLGRFAGSSVLRRLNTGDRDAAAKAFALWNKARIDGRLTVLPGLVRRRAAEQALFLKPAVGEGD